jgi:chemotaxis protein MotB
MRKHRRPLDSVLMPDISDWTLGNSVEPASLPSRGRLPLPRRLQLPQTPSRAPLSCAAFVAVLVHTAVLFFLWQQFGSSPEDISQPVDTQQNFAVEFTPSSDPSPNQENRTDNTAAAELQHFHSTALERADALEQTLTQALSHQADTAVTHQQQLTSLEAATTRMSGDLATLAEENTTLSAQLAEERQRTLTLTQQVQEAERAKAAELAGVKGTYDRLVAALQGEISQKEIALHQAKEQLTVTILDRVLFPSGRAALTPEGARIIAKVATILAKIGDRRIMIEGHTDNVPIRAPLSMRFPTNWELSTARATEVVKHLLSQGKLGASQLSAVGRADTAPVASNVAEEGRRLNRRIEIIVLPPEDASSRFS